MIRRMEAHEEVLLSKGYDATKAVTRDSALIASLSRVEQFRAECDFFQKKYGMRIPVSLIVGQIAHGASFEEILEGYPDLDRVDIQQALEYAAWLTHKKVHAVEAQRYTEIERP